MIPDLTPEARRRVFWPKVALIGSLRFYQEMLRLYNEFGNEGVDALVPWPHYRDPEDLTKYNILFASNEERLAVVRKQELETQLLRVHVSDLAYIINPDGHIEERDLVAIGVALQTGKDVYSMEGIAGNRFADKIRIKSSQEVLEIAASLKETKYRPLLEKFEQHMNE